VGCGAVKHHPGSLSEIKRMWVAESARGLGIGPRLLTGLEACAAAPRWRDWKPTGRSSKRSRCTAQPGTPKCRGFNDEPFAHHWFEQQLV